MMKRKLGIRGRFLGFHRDSGGQMSFLAVFGTLFIVAMFAMVLNTGYQSASKVQLQNAVDGATLSAAGWYARGLNVTSGLSVTQMQMVSAAMLLNAFAGSAPSMLKCAGLIPIYAVACKAGIAASPTGIGLVAAVAVCACEVQMKACVKIMRLAEKPLEGLSLLTNHSSGPFWIPIQLIGKFNGIVRKVFGYHFLLASGRAVAQQSGAPMSVDYIPFPGGWFHGERQWPLPTKKSKDATPLCNAAWNGSKGLTELHDYSSGEGPVRVGRFRLRAIATAIGLCAGWPFSFEKDLWMNHYDICPGGAFDFYELDASNQKLLLFGMADASYPPGLLNAPFLFRKPPKKVAFAEAEIYNGIAEETFSQDWRVRLRPVSLPWQHLPQIQGTALGWIFRKLTGINPADLGVTSNH